MFYLPIGYPHPEATTNQIATPEAEASLTDVEWLLWQSTFSEHRVLEIADTLVDLMGSDDTPPKQQIQIHLAELAKAGLVLTVPEDPVEALAILSAYRWIPLPENDECELNDTSSAEQIMASEPMIVAIQDTALNSATVAEAIQTLIAYGVTETEEELAPLVMQFALEGIGVLGYLAPVPVPVKPKRRGRPAKIVEVETPPLLALLAEVEAGRVEIGQSYTATVTVDDWNAVLGN